MADDVEATLTRLAELIAGSPHNLVSRSDRADVLGIHVRECQAYAGVLDLAPGQRWIDVGTGGGLPGLVLAVMAPDTHWTLVDSVGKKAAAVGQFAAELGLGNVTVLTGRAEDLAHEAALRGQFSGAISRAVAALPTLLELLAAFVAPEGAVVAAKGPRWEQEVAAARPAAELLGLDEARVVPIPDAARPTWLVMMRRHRALPKGYPRRAGLPKSQPLGGARA